MTSKQILVIDDDAGVRDIIRFGLTAVTDWEIVTAASGQEGITKAQTQQPDAILLDMMMPGMDGAMTFERLQSDTKTCQIPTILLTAKAGTFEHRTLLEQGIKGCIAKPFKARLLAVQIRDILMWD
jgi:CheY-like chemotaxis protein